VRDQVKVNKREVAADAFFRSCASVALQLSVVDVHGYPCHSGVICRFHFLT